MEPRRNIKVKVIITMMIFILHSIILKMVLKQPPKQAKIFTTSATIKSSSESIWTEET